MRKKQCEESLDMLLAEKAITLKEYGKAKIYLINQDQFPEVDKKLMDELDEQIEDRRTKYGTVHEAQKELEKKAKDAANTMTN